MFAGLDAFEHVLELTARVVGRLNKNCPIINCAALRFERSFKRTGRRHDLIALRITDPRERDLPAVGLLELEDAETGHARAA